uniref:Secreted protein n=1 Tax=Anopheles darlingi TaxID=43151 RepID=A0A2M4D160_ANODA
MLLLLLTWLLIRLWRRVEVVGIVLVTERAITARLRHVTLELHLFGLAVLEYGEAQIGELAEQLVHLALFVHVLALEEDQHALAVATLADFERVAVAAAQLLLEILVANREHVRHPDSHAALLSYLGGHAGSALPAFTVGARYCCSASRLFVSLATTAVSNLLLSIVRGPTTTPSSTTQSAPLPLGSCSWKAVLPLKVGIPQILRCQSIAITIVSRRSARSTTTTTLTAASAHTALILTTATFTVAATVLLLVAHRAAAPRLLPTLASTGTASSSTTAPLVARLSKALDVGVLFLERDHLALRLQLLL